MNQDESEQAKKTSVAVCIAGAHRSGTSMLTRLLHSSGLDLGPESELMPAQADNPDGFWENLRFVALNDEVLNEVGGAWDLPPPTGSDFEDARLDPMRVKARLLIDRFNSAKTWGWKDPRNSLTLPFWRPLLPDLKIVMMVRNPLEVAYSMRSRNGTSYSFGLRLWEIYHRRLLESTSVSERLVSHYDSLFENPATELERIARFIGLPPSSTNTAAALVIRTRRHTHFTMDQLFDARVSTEIIELYQELIQEAGRLPDHSAGPGQTKTEPETDSRRAKRSPDLIPGAISRLNVSIPNAEPVRRELAELRGDKISSRSEIERLNHELAYRDGRITELVKNVTRLETQAQELAAHAARLDAEIEQIRDRFIQTNHLLHDRSISLADAEARAAELTTVLRGQLHAVRRLSRLLNDVEAAADRLRSSRRWKMANPIAALRAALFPKRRLSGYGHLEKIVSAYSKWRSIHPEIGEIDDALHSLTPRSRSPGSSADADSSPNGSGVRRFAAGPPREPIAFPIHDEVEVSIIIPVYNQFSFTQACLASLQHHGANEPFEVVVVDDNSTDETAAEIARATGVVYLRNESNVGFIASCNRGAQKARGRFLVFLNNDTEVTAGWLDALRETFRLEARAGLVGAKLVFPDGRLQEAGGIIWRDATGWNFGKFDDPGKPEYNFLREVDYSSAACVMVPKSLFEEVGGFDPKFAPAYYEDVDLAFKIRRTGAIVFYQPLSTVIHFEGATGGTDISAGTKKYQEANRAKFAETWSEILAHKARNGDLATHEALPEGLKRILVMDHHLPMPDRDAGSLRMFHILDLLHQLGHRVTFIPDNIADIPPYGSELRKRGIEVIHHPYCKSVRDYLEKHGSRFEVVILSRCDFARKHIADVRHYAPRSRIIFDTVDLHHLRMNREAELTQDSAVRVKAEEKKRQEYQLIDEADETWVVSRAEQELIGKERPDKSVEVIPTIVDVPGSNAPFSLRRDFLFIGSFQHTPNVDAVIFFATEIYPLIKAHLPREKFYVIGDKAPPPIIALASENIIITGLQPDIRPYFESVRLSVAPLRFGAGVKGKINLSMGFGVPVVATTLAVEGMDLQNREDVLIADTPQDFANAVIEGYESEGLWNRISGNGVTKTKEHYSREAVRKQLSHLFGDRDQSRPQFSSTAPVDRSQSYSPSPLIET